MYWMLLCYMVNIIRNFSYSISTFYVRKYIWIISHLYSYNSFKNIRLPQSMAPYYITSQKHQQTEFNTRQSDAAQLTRKVWLWWCGTIWYIIVTNPRWGGRRTWEERLIGELLWLSDVDLSRRLLPLLSAVLPLPPPPL